MAQNMDEFWKYYAKQAQQATYYMILYKMFRIEMGACGSHL
jgi:hypothetical protein